MKRSDYQVIEVTDLRTQKRSFKVYKRPAGMGKLPIFAGIPTRAEAEAKVRELDQQELGAQP